MLAANLFVESVEYIWQPRRVALVFLQGCCLAWKVSMSRIGKKQINIPTGIKVNFANSVVSVEGPKGKLASTISPLVEVGMNDKTIDCKFVGDESEKAIHGITRT